MVCDLWWQTKKLCKHVCLSSPNAQCMADLPTFTPKTTQNVGKYTHTWMVWEVYHDHCSHLIPSPVLDLTDQIWTSNSDAYHQSYENDPRISGKTRVKWAPSPVTSRVTIPLIRFILPQLITHWFWFDFRPFIGATHGKRSAKGRQSSHNTPHPSSVGSHLFRQKPKHCLQSTQKNDMLSDFLTNLPNHITLTTI